MEHLTAAVAASCPLAFDGASGHLFVKAVTALVAAHCGIVQDYQWPEDKAEKIFMTHEANLTFDFIVVGAGTAGTIVASRLADYFPLLSILLIESGSDPGLDSEVPALLFMNQNTDTDWKYKTDPDYKSCLGFNDNSCIWSKGRAMGGSSSINAMLYIRGHPNDYNKWQEDGNMGWGYEDLKPYFEKLERRLGVQKCKDNMSNPWYDIINGAWKELGLNYVNDVSEVNIGTRITKLLTKNGKRLNTAKIYLSEKANLHVMKKTTAQKIIVDSTANNVNGVEIMQSNGNIMMISVRNEVILSAGSIATPQILMLSGIGPKKYLEENAIDCRVNLPVGKNLQDHILLPIFLKSNFHTVIPADVLNSFLLQYMMSRTGPFSNIGITDFMGFINTENLNYPNIQFHHTHFIQNDTFMLRPYLKGVGYKRDIIDLIEQSNEASDLLGIYPTLLHPRSKGEILLASSHPTSKPIIKPNYFNDLQDLESLRKGIKFIKNLTQTQNFKRFDIKIVNLQIPGCMKFSLDSESYWECYIRHMATTIYHPVGTAKMGAKARGGVVNADLLVHGINNLRVVDASVMPIIASGNTMAPTMVIAEKAADIILRRYKYEFKDEL